MRKLFGQDLVIDVLVNIITAHVNNPSPPKPLVLSFHGPTGVGKTHVSNIIVDHLFSKKLESAFFRKFSSTVNFKLAAEADNYKVIFLFTFVGF